MYYCEFHQAVWWKSPYGYSKLCNINTHTKINTLYGNYYPPHGEFKLICIGEFARRTWVNFIQQYGENCRRCQQNIFCYAVWQLLLYFYRELPLKVSPCRVWIYVYYGGPFSTFIFYFVLAPENSVRNEEKKILAKSPRRKKTFRGRYRWLRWFTSTFIIFFCYYDISLFWLVTSDKCAKLQKKNL